jgi:hypothetical protein
MKSELDLELRVRQLEGETLSRIHYQQLRWSAPAALHSPPHPVELAVFVECESGRKLRFGWADELGLHHGHGISLSEVRVIDRDAGPLTEVVWPRRRIVAASVLWRNIYDSLRGSFSGLVGVGGDHLRRQDYPQSIQLDLDGGGQIFVSAARLTGDGAEGFSNHLLVLFSRSELERLGL